jgi:hypothetical protein
MHVSYDLAGEREAFSQHVLSSLLLLLKYYHLLLLCCLRHWVLTKWALGRLQCKNSLP